MNRNKDIEKELKELGSRLPSYEHRPDGLPTGYFDRLEDEILSKTVRKQSTAKVFNIQKWMPAIAAGLVLMITLMWSLSDKKTTSLAEQYDSDQIISYLIDDEIDYINGVDLETLSIDPFEEMSYEDVERYLDDNLEDIDHSMIGDINW